MIAIVEIPQGSRLKYEVDKNDWMITLDRVLSIPVPFNYGFIPETYCEDGDALDVFILGTVPICPLAKVKIKVLGVLNCIDNGLRDDKIVATIVGDSPIDEAPCIEQLCNYLSCYKAGFEVLSFSDDKEAMETYQEAVESYRANK